MKGAVKVLGERVPGERVLGERRCQSWPLNGDWVTAGNYGRWWHPEDGWTWVLYDPWGGDPYHYGTWSRSDAYG